MEQNKTIVFMDFTSLGQASIVKGALESNNIACFLSNESSPFVGSMFIEPSGVRLHIFEKDLEKAEELYALVSSVKDDEDDEDDENDEEGGEMNETAS
jgi:Putative prokaryotic signal transducing protein